jgi:hypothetical protein
MWWQHVLHVVDTVAGLVVWVLGRKGVGAVIQSRAARKALAARLRGGS